VDDEARSLRELLLHCPGYPEGVYGTRLIHDPCVGSPPGIRFSLTSRVIAGGGCVPCRVSSDPGGPGNL